MSLCAFVNNNMKGVSSSNDLVQIMNLGSERYSSMMTMLEENEQAKYIENYYHKGVSVLHVHR